MTKKNQPLAVIEYTCGHTTVFSDSLPKVGDLACCRVCGKTVRVKRNDGDQWKAICRTDGCKYSANMGIYGKLAAERAGAKHRARKGNTNHIVDVLKPDGSVHHRYDNQGQLELPSVIVTDT